MAPKMRWTRTKRFLQDCHDENHSSQREVQEISDHQNLAGSISEAENAISGRDEEHQIHPRSRRGEHQMHFNCLSVYKFRITYVVY
ncbi:hypothetical protein RchiOBHm_Chr7g0200701 [Rosa chinensis]|uniref:Uncharacterized protein n=1 Tax=Rosa chinensis TaxID=74649 RepID=A0A2P6P7Q7_ROSCH|nr:hypothetical protein RchiOBHm_Chr7g0200701 [Rosa chinensis]